MMTPLQPFRGAIASVLGRVGLVAVTVLAAQTGVSRALEGFKTRSAPMDGTRISVTARLGRA